MMQHDPLDWEIYFKPKDCKLDVRRADVAVLAQILAANGIEFQTKRKPTQIQTTTDYIPRSTQQQRKAQP
jgi:hypothetical protein